MNNSVLIPPLSRFRVVGFDDEPDVRSATRLRLREFVQGWFSEHWLKKKSPRTFEKYRQLLVHWERLTNDPFLDEITSETVELFAQSLRECQVRRGRFGRKVLPLAHDTRGSVMRLLRCCLRVAFRDARLLSESVSVHVEPPHLFPKDSLTKDQLRAVIAVARQQHGTIAGIAASQWWTMAYALAFYGCCRRGQMFALTWRCVDTYRGETALKIGAATSKEKKPRFVICHPLLRAALESFPRGGIDSRILPLQTATHERFVTAGHKRFQRRVGIARPCSWHSLRGSFSCELASLGAERVLEAAREALNHSTTAVTEGSYLPLENVLMRFLPNLW